MASHSDSDDRKVADEGDDGRVPISFRAPAVWLEKFDKSADRYGYSRAESIMTDADVGFHIREKFEPLKARLFDYMMSRKMSFSDAVFALVEMSLDQIDKARETARKKGART